MKFGDKLIALRKKKGLSQEELAEKLNVSRQSVSKWESNNTYPETDKIVQICNIFECSMDDLINDNIIDITKIERKNKNNINIVMDSFLEFITKTINMFSRMKFSNGLKCVLEMIIISVIMLILGFIFINFSEVILNGFYPFSKGNIFYVLNGIIKSILMLIWTIISLIVLVHIFKIRYLNYYNEIINDEKKQEKTKTKIQDDKKEKIIIRDENTRPFAFLSVLSKIIIIIVKAFAILLGFFLMFTLFMITIGFVISLYFSFSNIMFIGSTLTLIAFMIINIIILMLVIGFIFEKKYNFKVLLITFLTSLVISGIGIGFFALGIKNFKIIDNMQDILNLKNHNQEIIYKDNMVILNNRDSDYYDDLKYEIDNTLQDNKIIISSIYDDKYIKQYIHSNIKYKINVVNIGHYENGGINYVLLFIDDIKNNIIRNYNYNYSDVTIKANEKTINNLMENLKKLYNYDYNKNNNIYKINNLTYKISDNTGETCNYNAINDELKCNEYEGKCYVKKIKSDNKEYINIYCE